MDGQLLELNIKNLKYIKNVSVFRPSSVIYTIQQWNEQLLIQVWLVYNKFLAKERKLPGVLRNKNITMYGKNALITRYENYSEITDKRKG